MRPDPQRYRQLLLHRDPAGRFSLVAFVWGPGQHTPVHDHKVWGLVAVHKGVELSQRYRVSADAPPEPVGHAQRLERGEIELLWPPAGDVHRVENGLADRASVSIHLYGADIGTVRRNSFPTEGGARPFVSGYANGPDTPPFVLA